MCPFGKQFMECYLNYYITRQIHIPLKVYLETKLYRNLRNLLGNFKRALNEV